MSDYGKETALGRRGYLCVGGPRDGEIVWVQPDARTFETVASMSPPIPAGAPWDQLPSTGTREIVVYEIDRFQAPTHRSVAEFIAVMRPRDQSPHDTLLRLVAGYRPQPGDLPGD